MKDVTPQSPVLLVLGVVDPQPHLLDGGRPADGVGINPYALVPTLVALNCLVGQRESSHPPVERDGAEMSEDNQQDEFEH